MARELLEVPKGEKETQESPFSFLLRVDEKEFIWDIWIVFSFKKNNVASEGLTLTTSVRSNQQIIQQRVQNASGVFLKRFPGNHPLREDAETFVENVQEKLDDFLKDSNQDSELDI